MIVVVHGIVACTSTTNGELPNAGLDAGSDASSAVCGDGVRGTAADCTEGPGVELPGCSPGLARCGATCVELLTDSANCGECGLTCESGCKAGSCRQSLATTPAAALAVDGASVFYGDSITGDLMRVPLAGGAPSTVAAGAGAGYIVLDDTRAYWARSVVLHGVIASAPKDGSTAATTIATEQNGPSGLAIGAGSLFWTNEAQSSNGSVETTPIAVPALRDIAVAQSRPRGIAVDGTSVFWSNYATGTAGGLFTCPLAGCSGAPTRLLDAGPASVALDSANTYSVGDAGIVKKVPKSGGNAIDLAIGPMYGHGIVTDGVDVYWVADGAAPDSATILKVPVTGGAVATLASGLTTVRALALAGRSLAFTSQAGVTKITPR